MSLLQVGAGGWAYFKVEGEASLQAYSKAFDFVEVNSTYYEQPKLDTVRSWRYSVPEDFEFSVRCNRALLTEYYSSQRNGRRESLLAFMEWTCRVLGASILAVLFRDSDADSLSFLDQFLSDFRSKGTRVAVELRGARATEDFAMVLERHDAIHSVDVSKGEAPLLDSGILYTRLFGGGEGNVYEFDDAELKQVFGTAISPKFEKSILAFHGVRMYRDAARLKTFAKTGEFPGLTKSTGLVALQKVLEEDAVFPTTGHELAERQGWKLFDLTSHSRSKLGKLLEKLPPDRVFTSPVNVRESLERIVASQFGVFAD